MEERDHEAAQLSKCCWAVGEDYSYFGYTLVWMTTKVFSIFQKLRSAGSDNYNGDIVLLGFFSFFKKLYNSLNI